MTITLHWWALPVALCVVAAVFAYLSRRNSYDGMFSGLGEGLVSCALVVMALMVCVGHWL